MIVDWGKIFSFRDKTSVQFEGYKLHREKKNPNTIIISHGESRKDNRYIWNHFLKRQRKGEQRGKH